jgi:hypothetical protein
METITWIRCKSLDDRRLDTSQGPSIFGDFASLLRPLARSPYSVGFRGHILNWVFAHERPIRWWVAKCVRDYTRPYPVAGPIVLRIPHAGMRAQVPVDPGQGRVATPSWQRSAHARPLQQPRQIDSIILSTFASSRSMEGLVPSSGPFTGPRPTPDDESAVPNELVPGAAALLPKAPPVEDICDPMPPPRANAVVERLMQRTMQRMEGFFMPRLLRARDQDDD